MGNINWNGCFSISGGYDCNCCCNPSEKKCYEVFIIFVSIFIFAFQLIIVITSTNSINPQDFESYVLSETPLFDFEISKNDISDKRFRF